MIQRTLLLSGMGYVQGPICASACLCTGSGKVLEHDNLDGQWISCIHIWFCWQWVCLCFLQLLARQNALRERAATRRRLLEDSLLLQQLYQDSDDLKNWINKKKKLADDEDYKVGRICKLQTLDILIGTEFHGISLGTERTIAFSWWASFYRWRDRYSEKGNDSSKTVHQVSGFPTPCCPSPLFSGTISSGP